MSCSVRELGGRWALRAAIAGVAASALLVSAADAEARSKKRHFRIVKPVAAATFTGAANYAALVVDAKTGRTLYDKNADDLRFPASVTKVMTLYLVFEDLDRGRIKLDSNLTMTPRCAAQAPSKLGLRPGQTISVQDGILALVTKSANDVACAFGDNLEGSEAAFADRMTRKAHSIGMSRTVYRNASGLPNPSHVTTARDLVTLGRAIQDRFPRYYGYFGTRVFAWGRQRIANHNRLLGRVEGVDGIKTGYTNASGFNLLTSVKSQGRAVVAVVMGGRTGASRDAHMQQLIAMNLPKAMPGSRTAPLVADADPAPVRARNQVAASTPSPLAPAPSETEIEAEIAMPTAAPRQRETVQREPAVERWAPTAAVPKRIDPVDQPVEASSPPVRSIPTPARSAPQSMRWIVGTGPAVTGSVPEPIDIQAEEAAEDAPAQPAQKPVGAPTARRPGAAAAQAAPVRKGWMIQIGATTEATAAEALLDNARSKGGRVLTSAESFTETYTKGATTYYRARFAGLDEQTADAACRTLKRSSVSCFAIKN